MKIKKTLIGNMEFPYAITTYEEGGRKLVACGTETSGGCISFDAKTGEVLDTLWTGPGGTMTIRHISDGEFLATHRFFKRFQAQAAVVSAVTREADGSWSRTEVLKLPYLHRFCVLDVGNEKWLLGGTLCDGKASFEDWSQPGGVYVGRIPDNIKEPIEVKCIYHGIRKNHGMFCGLHNGRQVAMVTGCEGAFEVIPPDNGDGAWLVKKLLDTEISDIRAYDIDGDGKDELITIEGFHGDRLRVYHESGDGFKLMYEYPIAFGHGLWCGEMLGRRAILIGYKNANGALVALQPKDAEVFTMDIAVIDELEQTANIDVYESDGVFRIYAACSVGDILMYELTEN